jgi:glycerol-3-phosphate dehydrogenase
VSSGGLVTVTGGKWTTYRRMAQDVMDTAVREGLVQHAACRTQALPLHGAAGLQPPRGAPATPDAYYGSDLAQLQALPGFDRMLVKASWLTEAHVRYAARCELARTAEDVLARRNRALFLDRSQALAAAPEVARILAEELGHDAAWQQQTLAEFEKTARQYRLAS